MSQLTLSTFMPTPACHIEQLLHGSLMERLSPAVDCVYPQVCRGGWKAAVGRDLDRTIPDLDSTHLQRRGEGERKERMKHTGRGDLGRMEDYESGRGAAEMEGGKGRRDESATEKHKGKREAV